MKRKFIIWKYAYPLSYRDHEKNYYNGRLSLPQWGVYIHDAERYDSYNEVQTMISTLGEGIYGIKTIYINEQ